MKVDVERISNGKDAPYWYGVHFTIQNGKPLLIEGRIPSAVVESKEQGEKSRAALAASMGNFAKEKSIPVVSYPDKDKKRDGSLRAKKRIMSHVDIANEALKHIGTVGSVAALSDSIEQERLERMIELARKAGFFFPKPPSAT